MLKPTFSEHFWFCQISGFKKEESSEKSTNFITFWLMLAWNIAVPLSWGLLKYDHFGGQQLHQSQDFYPTFPWLSDLTSCWEVLAFASGSVETTSCPESSWMWLCAEVPFSRDQGCGIQLKSREKKKSSFAPTSVALQGWRGLLCSRTPTVGLQQWPRLP